MRPALKGLQSWTRQQVAVQESLATYLSYRPFVADLRAQVARSLGELVRAPLQIGRTQMRALSRQEALALLPEVTCLAAIGMAPSEHKMIAECDPGLAAQLIDRLLGGEGKQELQRITPLTQLESGVLSFVAVHVLHHFHSGWHSGAELGLVLDRTATHALELEALWQASETFVCLSWGLSLGEQSGGIRLFVPGALVSARFGGRPATPRAEQVELAAMRHNLRLLEDLPVTARLVASQIDLPATDIANVGLGDIIVLEKHRLKKTTDGLSGELFVHLGAGRHGGFRAQLRFDDSEPSQLSLEVVSIEVQEQPMVDEASPAPPAEPDDNLTQTQGLLPDLEAPVVVELGRLRMNTAQVIRLRAGQILKLARGPSDPVDLVVGDKVFARGELIEVEGDLGVRLTQVAGADAPA